MCVCFVVVASMSDLPELSLHEQADFGANAKYQQRTPTLASEGIETSGLDRVLNILVWTTPRTSHRFCFSSASSAD